jgi:transcriptional regulator with XRE-family HTH domain
MADESSTDIKKPRAPRPSQPVSIAFGKRLKELRIAAGLSQTELAFDCELDRTYITAIERGVANPSLWTLATIAYALKTALPALFEGNLHTMSPEQGKRRKNQASHEGDEPPVGTRKSKLR